MIKKTVLLMLFAFTINLMYAIPDEGMWLPLYIKKLNEAKMKELGYKLTAEDIYDINNASFKDAVVRLGSGFCTGEIVSDKGLVFTNHHCGYEAIASLSSVDNDFLTNGFWAMNLSEEIPIPGFSVSRLVYMQDITEYINSQTNNISDEGDKQDRIDAIIDSFETAAIEGTHYEAEVNAFFGETEYYLLVYETFTDVRFVGAPPSSIGKFGGDTDNWMWPRHTGDFSVLRIYSGADGKPASYDPENIPYKPLKYFNVSLKGVQNNDYAMILGYPGTTERYLSSYDIDFKLNHEQPALIDIFNVFLKELKVIMDAKDQVRIDKASEYASISNTWKYLEGQNLGLRNYNLLDQYKEKDKELTKWINQNPEMKEKYEDVLPGLEQAYARIKRIMPGMYYLAAGVLRLEVIGYIRKVDEFRQDLESGKPASEMTAELSELKEISSKLFSSSTIQMNKTLLAYYLFKFSETITDMTTMPLFAEINTKYKGEIFKDKLYAYVDDLYKTSILFNEEKMNAYLEKPGKNTLKKDKVFRLYNELSDFYRNNYIMIWMSSGSQLNTLNNQYIALMKEWKKDKVLYPDANSTLRMTYGQVKPYRPRDAVFYKHYTTHYGILDKNDPNSEEFKVDPKLIDLLNKKDFGMYGVGDTLYVCFLTNNDITGGNSGSPVLNGNGELIGIAFDGNWEAMTGDLVVNPDYNRTINVDIRYVLFVIDKLGGAKHLIEELTIIK